MKELSTDAWSTIVIVFLILIVAMGVVGNGDYEDALAEEAHYTNMVCAGHWPDYKNLGISCETQQRANAGGNVSF